MPGISARPKVVVIGVSTGRADRAGRDPAAVCRPDFHCRFLLCSTCRLCSRGCLRSVFTPRAGCRVEEASQGAPGGGRQDIDCTGGLSSEGGYMRQRSARASRSVAAAELLPSLPSMRCSPPSPRSMAAPSSPSILTGMGHDGLRGVRDPQSARGKHPRAG